MQDPLAGLTNTRSSLPIGAAVTFLRKRKWLILGLTAAAAVATGVVVSRKPPIYEATASIIVETALPQYMGAGFRDLLEVQPNWWQSHETLETEFRTLRSRSNATTVAKALCQRQFQGAPALRFLVADADCNNPESFTKAAPKLQTMLVVRPLRESRVVELTVRSTSPEFAAMLANMVAEVYAAENLQRRLSYSAGAATWLGDEYQQLMNELRSAEQALIDFKKNNNVVEVSIDSNRSELANRRGKISEELNMVEVKLIAARTDRAQLEAFANNDALDEVNPALARSEAAQKLKALYSQEYGTLLALQGKYLEKHPAVTAQQQRLKFIREDLAREIELTKKNFDLQHQALTSQAADLRAAMQQTTREALSLESKSSEYYRLKRDLDRLIKLSEQVGGRERETTLASNLKTNNVRLLDAAIVPVKPAAPNVPKAIAQAIGVGLLLSIGLAFLLDAIDNTVKTQEDIEQNAGLTFLGIIPSIEKEEGSGKNGKNGKNGKGHRDPPPPDLPGGDSRELWVFSHPKSQVAECCRAIRTNLLFMSPDRPPKSLLITSAGPQEGKTTVAASLGITMALSGLRVLLVDTDMRRPRLHKAFGLPSTGDGLSAAILGRLEVMNAVRPSPVPNLSLLPCGATPPNPAELLHSERFLAIVKELDANFDLVMFDSPPLGAVTDAAILARLAEATLLVAKAGRTSRFALARARRQVSIDRSVNVLGCVLNDISLSRQREYGYYSYYYYSRYGYYGRPEEQAGKGATPS
jgi:polysaccharide biosynthesis transport protein